MACAPWKIASTNQQHEKETIEKGTRRKPQLSTLDHEIPFNLFWIKITLWTLYYKVSSFFFEKMYTFIFLFSPKKSLNILGIFVDFAIYWMGLLSTYNEPLYCNIIKKAWEITYEIKFLEFVSFLIKNLSYFFFFFCLPDFVQFFHLNL